MFCIGWGLFISDTYVFVTDGRIDVGVGANERSWCVDVQRGCYSLINNKNMKKQGSELRQI